MLVILCDIFSLNYITLNGPQVEDESSKNKCTFLFLNLSQNEEAKGLKMCLHNFEKTELE